ncbi:MAG: hypothetical protein DRP87_15200, partial [Spirochaetes bacterium]
TFHANPDYALWYGWSEMVRNLTEIKEEAEELRTTAIGTRLSFVVKAVLTTRWGGFFMIGDAP